VNSKILQTFIIGAGASYPYGFPLSDGLIAGIRSSFVSAASETAKLLHKDPRLLKSATEEATAFSESLNGLAAISIDKFLNLNPKWLDIGRMAIIVELLRLEKLAKSPGDVGIDGDWYVYLFSKLMEGLDSVDSIRSEFGTGFKVVTFNYDRSLEHFIFQNLYRILRATTPKEEIERIAGNLEIIHVYGSLGRLPWQTDLSLGKVVDFGDFSNDVYSRSQSLRDNIQLIYDQRSTVNQLERAKSAILPANRVLLLGFGYDYKNIENLDLRNCLNGKSVFATGYKMTENERIHSRNQITNDSGSQRQETRVIDADCLLLCREYLISRLS